MSALGGGRESRDREPGAGRAPRAPSVAAPANCSLRRPPPEPPRRARPSEDERGLSVHRWSALFVTRRDATLCLCMGRCCVGEAAGRRRAPLPTPSAEQIAPCSTRRGAAATPAASPGLCLGSGLLGYPPSTAFVGDQNYSTIILFSARRARDLRERATCDLLSLTLFVRMLHCLVKGSLRNAW